MLDPILLHDFIARFFGYGSWRARYSFIGMEEGGGDSEEEISRQQFEPVASQRFVAAEAPSTRFVIAPHPVARGVTNADFDGIGTWIAARL